MVRAIQNKEQVIRDLLNTFNTRDKLHMAYKAKMKDILLTAFEEFGEYLGKTPEEFQIGLPEWVEDFVEEHFKPKDL